MNKTIKKICSTISMLALSLTLLSVNVQAKENDDIESLKKVREPVATKFTEYSTKENKDYVKKRDKLIEKYGIKKAYEMMGAELVSKEIEPIDTIQPLSISDPGGGGATPSRYTSKYIGNNNRAFTEISVYKTSGFIDCVYEISYPQATRPAGVDVWDDAIGVSFDNVGTGLSSYSVSSSINSWSQSQNGGKGYITDHSTYAWVIQNTVPRNGASGYSVVGSCIMDIALKKLTIPEGFPISIGAWGVSFGANLTTFDPYQTFLPWQ